MASRAQQVADRLAARELGALLVTGAANLRWLTGFTGSSGLAIVGPGAARHFFTDFRYDDQSATQLDRIWQRHIVPELGNAAAELLSDLQSGRPLRVGFDDAELTVARHAALEEVSSEGVVLVRAGGVIEALRMVKDDDEVALIRAATALADTALTEVLGRGLVGRTEADVATDLDVTMRKAGASGSAFTPIVAFGAHGALPHAYPRDIEIPPDVLVTIDWGAQLDGYASDCTRTFATGDIGDTEREVYDLVLRAEEAAVAATRAGIGGRELDAVARTIISDAGHGERFGHGLGHGVGIEVHEGPRLSVRSEDTLVAGQVVTIEPGVYLPGVCGVRIEDLVVVGVAGCEVLTGLPRALQTIV